MNRKLINGLLLLTVSASGVGMLTSCKDNEDALKVEQKVSQTKLAEYILGELDSKINGLQSQLNGLSGDVEAIKAEIADLQSLRDRIQKLENAKYLTEADYDNLKALIDANTESVKELTNYVNSLVMNLITSVEVQDVYNPMFGKINLPIGIEGTLLANYYYQADHEISFPRPENPQYEYADKDALNLSDLTWLSLGVESETYPANEVLMGAKGLGDIYVTINPSTVPAEGLTVRLAKTNGEYVLGQLTPVKEDEYVKTFGMTKAVNNGFYRINVTAGEGQELAENVELLKIDIADGLKSALKDAIKNHTASDFATLALKIYNQFNGILPAYGLEVSNQPKISLDASADAADVVVRNVYSRYNIAATTYRPLSFSTDPEGYVPERRLPDNVGHIQQYIQKIVDKLNFSLDLGLDTSKYNFSLDLSNVKFEIEKTSITIDLANTPVYSRNDYTADGSLRPGAQPIGYLDPDAVITLGYDPAAGTVTTGDADALNPLVAQIVAAVNGDATNPGFKGEIEKAVNDQLIAQVNDMVADLNGQLKDINNTINDKVSAVKDEINALANNQFGKVANRLIDLYNGVAKKINSILDNPNAYLQVYAAYADGNGSLHHLSTVPTDPSVFKKGTGDALKLYLTSYNAELLVPAFKKYVAIVGAVGQGIDVDKANQGGANVNEILEGTEQEAAINVSNLQKGVVYQVLYTALDFRGNTSSRYYYFTIAD